MSELILNVAAGKMDPLFDITASKDVSIINIDTCYENYITFSDIEKMYMRGYLSSGENHYVNHDVFDFLERTMMFFDTITIYRFLEHVSKNNIQYFIYLLSNCTKIGGMIDIIVPDAKLLAIKLLDEDVNSPNWESEDLLITYELVADQPSPHLSIWTKDRLIKLFEREGNFKTKEVTENFEFDGRNIYVRYQAIREK